MSQPTNRRESTIAFLSLLRSCDPTRHSKAVAGLYDGSLTITLTYKSDSEIRTLVRNGEGTEHCLVITDRGNFCGCKDFAWRGVTCYHQIAAAVWCLQQAETPATPIHLWFPDGTAALCGETHPKRFWQRWTYNALSWSDVCPACVHTWTHPSETRDQLAA
jgi:hypothetical protein